MHPAAESFVDLAWLPKVVARSITRQARSRCPTGGASHSASLAGGTRCHYLQISNALSGRGSSRRASAILQIGDGRMTKTLALALLLLAAPLALSARLRQPFTAAPVHATVEVDLSSS